MRCMPRGAAMQGAHELPGDLLNVNTIEGFRNADKRALLQQVRAALVDAAHTVKQQRHSRIL